MKNGKEQTKGDASAAARARIATEYEAFFRKTFFDVLGVNSETPQAELRKNYHRLAKDWHVDAYAGLDLGKEQAHLEEIFKRLGEAYETLNDPAKRNEYIILLKRKSEGLATDVTTILRGEQRYDDALVAMRRKDWRAAVAMIEESISLNPDDPLYRATLGWATYNLNKQDASKVQAAIDIIKKATSDRENMAIGYQYLAQIYFSQDKYDDALRWWKKCLTWEPNNIDAARAIRLITTRKEKESKGFGAWLSRLLGKNS
jgi:curved DNA-binding protein CbpA